jgi:hydroxymethylglutaryl-CoA lyase
MPGHVEMVEVSARDGLQNEPGVFPTADKIALITRAVAAGSRRIEIASFVHPGRVPQMADAEAVCEGLGALPGVTCIGLVLNKKGALRALATRVDELGAVVSASDGFGRNNQGRTAEETLEDACEIIRLARDNGRMAQATISVAFGCPFDGETDVARVAVFARRLAEAGAREVALGDTIGVAVPAQVRQVMGAVMAAAPGTPIRLHFHDTRNTAVANAWAGVEMGAATLDASIGGIGGCPFAPNATGNVATEDVAYMLHRSGVETGLDLDQLIATARWLSGRMGRAVPGLVSRAGGFPVSRAT